MFTELHSNISNGFIEKTRIFYHIIFNRYSSHPCTNRSAESYSLLCIHIESNAKHPLPAIYYLIFESFPVDKFFAEISK